MPAQPNGPGANARLFGRIFKNTFETNVKKDKEAAQARRSGQQRSFCRRTDDRSRESRREPPRGQARPTLPPPSRTRDELPNPRNTRRSRPSHMAHSDAPTTAAPRRGRDTTPPKRKREEENEEEAQTKKSRTSPIQKVRNRSSSESATKVAFSHAKDFEATEAIRNETGKGNSLTTLEATPESPLTGTTTTAEKSPQSPSSSTIEQPEKSDERGAVAFISSKQFAMAKQKVAKVTGTQLETIESRSKTTPLTDKVASKKEEKNEIDTIAKPSLRQEKGMKEDTTGESSKQQQGLADAGAKSGDKLQEALDRSAAKTSSTLNQTADDAAATAPLTPGPARLMDMIKAAHPSSSLPSPPSSHGSPTTAKRSIAAVDEPEERAPKKQHQEVRMMPVTRVQLLARILARQKRVYNSSPTVPNDGGMHAYVSYGDDSVPVLQAAGSSRCDSLLNKPSIELKVDAVLLLERGIKAEDLGRAKGVVRKGSVKVIDDCDLYLRDKKLYVATEVGLLLAADYLKLAGIPETTKVRFTGVKPAWTKAFLATSHLRRIIHTTEDEEPEKVVCYPALPPGEVGLKTGHFIEVFGTITKGKTTRGYGRNVKTSKVGWFDYGKDTEAMDAPYTKDYMYMEIPWWWEDRMGYYQDGTEEPMEWDCVWEPEQKQELIDAEKSAATRPLAPESTPVSAPASLVAAPTPVVATPTPIVVTPEPVPVEADGDEKEDDGGEKEDDGGENEDDGGDNEDEDEIESTEDISDNDSPSPTQAPPASARPSPPQISTYERCEEDAVDYDDFDLNG